MSNQMHPKTGRLFKRPALNLALVVALCALPLVPVGAEDAAPATVAPDAAAPSVPASSESQSPTTPGTPSSAPITEQAPSATVPSPPATASSAAAPTGPEPVTQPASPSSAPASSRLLRRRMLLLPPRSRNRTPRKERLPGPIVTGPNVNSGTRPAARSIALGHVHGRRHRRQSGDDRAGPRIGPDVSVWIAKSLELAAARRSLRTAIARYRSRRAWPMRRSARKVATGRLARSWEQASLELKLSADILDKGGSRDRVATRLQGIVAAAGRSMNRGTGLLATIGSTAPFIGFSVPYGAHESFIGISKSQTTNLAVVAPGIAELFWPRPSASWPPFQPSSSTIISAFDIHLQSTGGRRSGRSVAARLADLDRGVRVYLVKDAAE